ncbi:MAG: ParB/RepB/Spo0J family partition protein [Peptostreptococcales bacterium]
MVAKRTKALGKGLEALFNDSSLNNMITRDESDERKEYIEKININNIKPNANQPRKLFDEEKLNELAESIKQYGIIQPIVVRKNKNGYEIIAGERRWRAARIAKVVDLPCIIKDEDTKDDIIIAIIENLQRENLNPIEEAAAIDLMIKEYKMTQEEVSKSLGKSRPYITNILRLLRLSPEIQEYVKDNRISSGHARALINIDNPEIQKKLADMTIEKGLSVRQLEMMANDEKTRKVSEKVRRNHEKAPEVIEIEEKLKTILGTKVKIKHSDKKGKIQIEYYSLEEFERIMEFFEER